MGEQAGVVVARQCNQQSVFAGNVDFAMFTHVRFLIAVGTGDGAPNPAPVLVLVVLLSQKTFLRHVGNRTDAVCLLADKRIEWSADGQTVISRTTVTRRDVNA